MSSCLPDINGLGVEKFMLHLQKRFLGRLRVCVIYYLHLTHNKSVFMLSFSKEMTPVRCKNVFCLYILYIKHPHLCTYICFIIE